MNRSRTRTWSRRRRMSAFAVGIAVLAALLAGCGGGESTAATLASVKAYHPIQGDPLGPATGSVRQASGGSWSYAHPPSGHLTLLYFGYTDCPDVCPLTMNDLAVAMRSLPPDVRQRVWVEFVSTDPHRDTPARLRHWIDSYSPTFHAGRAPIGRVVAAAQTYGLSVTRPKITKGDYQVTHGGDLMVLDGSGGAIGFFTQLAGWRAYAAAIPALVKSHT